MPATFAERLTAIDAETSRYLDDLEALLAYPDSPVSVDAGGQLHLKALTAEVIDPEVLAQRDAVVARLPRVPLTELRIEVDRESGFSVHLTRGGASPRHPELEHRRNLYAAILSLACNFGSTRMAELTCRHLCRHHRLDHPVVPRGRHAAGGQHRRRQCPPPPPVGRVPGRRHPVVLRRPAHAHAGQVAHRPGPVALLRARGPHQLHPHLRPVLAYGTQIIVSTERDATFTLDEILGNTTELPIIEHTTDSASERSRAVLADLDDALHES